MVLQLRSFLIGISVAALSIATSSCTPGGGSGNTGGGGAGGKGTGGNTGGTSQGGDGGTGGASGCKSDDDCAMDPGGPACKLDTGLCVACVTDDHCFGNTQNPVCNTSTNSCVHCVTNDDCAMDPDGQYCDAPNNRCVECIPIPDPASDCTTGEWCNPQTGVCEAGCTGNEDCGMLMCDLDKHKCVGCFSDNDCAAGSICIGESCVPGCNPSHACLPGQTCCGMSCYDLDNDEQNCGTCGFACPPIPNAVTACLGGSCELSMCQGFYKDCNQNEADGCETNTLAQGDCACTPGTVEACYNGLPGTAGVGECKSGTRVCKADGLGWTSCMGAIYPSFEICGNGKDEDCNGTIDDNADADGDGWTACEGDCDETNAGINIGALEVPGDAINNDCDAATPDTPVAACSTVGKLTGVTPDDVAKAIDICQTTTLNPPKATKKWGLITAEYKTGGGATPTAAQLTNYQNYQAAILTQYGYVTTPANPNNPPKKGPTMAGLSSGRMRYVGQTDYIAPQGGSSMGGADSCPAAYKAGNGGVLPSSAGLCGTCTTAQTCNDSINVKLQIRVPTNAKGMSYNFKFYSAEFPEWVCTSFNDFYLALLTSTAPGLPADKNISFDTLGNPVSVNNGFFDVCAPTTCSNGTPIPCPSGVAQLEGTGMANGIGGGTVWLTTDTPVVPGEVITLELMVFDVGDQILDSLTLLDNVSWKLTDTTLGTHK